MNRGTTADTLSEFFVAAYEHKGVHCEHADEAVLRNQFKAPLDEASVQIALCVLIMSLHKAAHFAVHFAGRYIGRVGEDYVIFLPKQPQKPKTLCRFIGEVRFINSLLIFLCPDIVVDRAFKAFTLEAGKVLFEANKSTHHARLFEAIPEALKEIARNARRQRHFVSDGDEMLSAKDRHIGRREIIFGECGSLIKSLGA